MYPALSPHKGHLQGDKATLCMLYRYTSAITGSILISKIFLTHIGSCAELKKAQKQYEREETEVCVHVLVYECA